MVGKLGRNSKVVDQRAEEGSWTVGVDRVEVGLMEEDSGGLDIVDIALEGVVVVYRMLEVLRIVRPNSDVSGPSWAEPTEIKAQEHRYRDRLTCR